jgi:hypothetical protein
VATLRAERKLGGRSGRGPASGCSRDAVPDVQKFRRGLLTVSEFQLARLTLPLASVPFDSASKFMARRGKYASKITAKPLKYRKFPIFHLTRCLTIQGYFEINLVRVTSMNARFVVRDGGGQALYKLSPVERDLPDSTQGLSERNRNAPGGVNGCENQQDRQPHPQPAIHQG